jgi:hypothetical protein
MNPRTPGDNALRHVGDLNRRIVENTGDCVKILALDGRLLYINPEGLRALEIADASPLMDCPLAGFFDGDVRRAAEAAMEQPDAAIAAASST